MSDFSQVTDAIVRDLTDNIPKLSEAQIHRYEPFDPQLLDASTGERHLAVWPTAEEPAERAEGIATGIHQLNQLYEIWVWEGGATEGDRLVRDESATAALLDLHNAIRDRIYLTENQEFGGSKLSWYNATQLPSVIGSVRWFRIRIVVQRFQAFT